MNKKGFTLVELVGVIVIIGLLLVLVATPIIGQIRNQQGRLSSSAKEIILNAVEVYLDDHPTIYPKKDGNTYYLSVSRLVEGGYLAEEFITDENINAVTESTIIKIKAEYNGYNTSVITEEKDNIGKIYDSLKNDSMYSYMGGKYFKGVLSNNYVLFSGNIWRIMGENKDGSIKLVSSGPISALRYGPSVISSFKNTYMYEWLNNYYLSRISNYDVLVKEPICVTKAASSNTSTSSCSNEELLQKAKVSLLSLEEYNLSIEPGSSYLESTTPFVTITQSDDENYYVLSSGTNYQVGSPETIFYVRPVISVDRNTIITSGEGTSTSPFVLDKELFTGTHTNKTVDSMYIIPGDYLSLNNIIYRVVEVDSSGVRILRNSFNTSTNFDGVKFADDSNNFSVDSGIGSVLNNTIFYNLYSPYANNIRTAVWYQGSAGTDSYKLTNLAKTNLIYSIKLGIPKLAELFTVPIGSSEYWTMSKADENTNLYTISTEGVKVASYTSTNKYIRETFVISKELPVTKGSGTISDPYVVIPA